MITRRVALILSLTLASLLGATATVWAGQPPAAPMSWASSSLFAAAGWDLRPPAAFGVWGSRPSSALARGKPAFVPGELLVEFRSGVGAHAQRTVVGAARARIVRDLPVSAAASGTSVVLIHSDSLSTTALAAQFARDQSVVATCPNYIRHIEATVPSDPGYADQWGLFRVQAPQAWQTTVGAPDVVVASIDTGVDFLHQDLAANMWHNPGEIPGNGIDDDGNGYVDDVYGINPVGHSSSPMDDFGHGTHTSGIIAAVGDNAIGVTGVSWNTQIMALKFISADGWGTDADAIACIDYVIKEKVDYGVNVVAINASWGGGGSSLFLRNAINNAGSAGIVFCAAAGNEWNNNDEWASYPASYDCPNIITVAATDQRDRLAYFSNWGQTTVDIGAPGVGVLSTLSTLSANVSFWGVPEAMYGSWDGTSMATPFVAGAVALCAAQYPAETVSQRIDRILSSADLVPALAGKCVSGGRLDISAALGEGAPSGDATPPTTVVLRADDQWHGVPVKLRLEATDGSGGSGIASTEWRLDGGVWRQGTLAIVPAPAGVQIVHTVDYRSTDKAANVETFKSCQVKIDTTAPSDNRLPGVNIPASPFAGAVSVRADYCDVYRVKLRRGETLQAGVSSSPGAFLMMGLFGPGAADLSGRYLLGLAFDWPGARPLAYRARVTGTYYLDVRSFGGTTPYQVTWSVQPDGVDVIAPMVDVHGAVQRWVNHPLKLTFFADDGRFGSGVATIESSQDAGVTWSTGDTTVVPAPADHSNDGIHSIMYRASDVAGNVSEAAARMVRIDTLGPTTEAGAYFNSVRRGARAVITYDMQDMTEMVWAQLIIRSTASGKIVKTVSMGWRYAPDAPPDGSYTSYYVFRCTMPRGTYDVLIAGTTHDSAGNLWSSAVCTKQLVVK